MIETDLYNLSWSDYESSLVSAVQFLQNHDELVDVTLVAGGRTFQAHKVVLCAASPFLSDMLKNAICEHPVVTLVGIEASVLETLLEFAYRGEVSVDSSQLPSLLQAAHCLNIQGLAPASPNILTPLMKTESVDNSDTADPEVQDILLSHGLSNIKPKKKVKRLSELQVNRLPIRPLKVHSHFDPAENLSSNSSGPQESQSTQVWSPQQHFLHTLSASTSPIEGLPIPNPILVPNIPSFPLNMDDSYSGGSKIRGASDQPGICPLCGCTLRQARNLRRHLVTSCKYKMGRGSQTVNVRSNTTSTETHQDIHQLQSVQDLNPLSHCSTDYSDDKNSATPINYPHLRNSTNSSTLNDV